MCDGWQLEAIRALLERLPAAGGGDPGEWAAMIWSVGAMVLPNPGQTRAELTELGAALKQLEEAEARVAAACKNLSPLTNAALSFALKAAHDNEKRAVEIALSWVDGAVKTGPVGTTASAIADYVARAYLDLTGDRPPINVYTARKKGEHPYHSLMRAVLKLRGVDRWKNPAAHASAKMRRRYVHL